MDTNWSDWLDLTNDNIRSIPESAVYGVYEIRLVDDGGRPIPLRRALGVDHEGITYIGASGVLRTGGPMLQKRLTLHRCAHANGKRGGAKDEDLNVLWRKITASHGEEAWMQYRYTIVSSGTEAQSLEGYLQAKHQGRFGEKHDYLWKSQAHPLFP